MKKNAINFKRGALLFNIGRYEMAEKEYREILVDDPCSAGAHTMVAWCLLKQKKLAEAEFEAKEAVAADPNQDGGYAALSAILLAEHRMPEALDAIGQAIAIAPLKTEHHGTLSSIYLNQRQWLKALSAAEAGLAIDPQNVVCTNARGSALTNLGRYEEASINNQVSLRIDSINAHSHSNQGWTLLSAGNHEEAVQFFDESLRIDPTSLWAQAGRKISLRERSFVSRGIQRYLRYIQRRSGVCEWSLIVGMVFLGYVGLTILTQLLKNDLVPEMSVWPLLIPYSALVYLTWLGSPMFVWVIHTEILHGYSLRTQSIAICVVAAIILTSLTLLGASLFHLQ